MDPTTEVILPRDRIMSMRRAALQHLSPGKDPHAQGLNGKSPIALFPVAEYGTQQVNDRPALDEGDIAPPEVVYDVKWLMEEFAIHEATLDRYEAQRNVVCWRLTREFGRSMGQIREGVPLEVAMLPGPTTHNPWYFAPKYTDRQYVGNHVSSIYYKAAKHTDTCRYVAFDALDNKPHVLKGMAFQPPGVHESLIDPETLTVDVDKYDPEQDKLLGYWIKAVEQGIKALDIEQGSPLAPDYGKKGIIGLTNPHYARFIWPTPADIIATENVLIMEMKDMIVNKGLDDSKKEMRKRWGLSVREVASLFEMGKALIKQNATLDKDTAKAIARSRLESLFAQAKENNQTRDALMVLKTLTILDGLGRNTEESGAEVFMKAVENIAEDRENGEVVDFEDYEQMTLPPPST